TMILATEPGEAAKLCERSTLLRAATRHLKPARVSCLDLALSQLPRPDDNFALGIDEPIYFSIHSTAARLAPDGAGLIHAAHFLAPGDKPRSEDVERLERLLDQIQPGWRGLEVHRQRLVGMTVTHDIPQARNQGRRTPVVVQDAPGLFLAGDWV